MKFDLLGLGMLTALDHALRIIGEHHGQHFELRTLPQEDTAVYDMLCEGDSVGVFQVESRAQISTLPRLRPREFYDLVVEVALILSRPHPGRLRAPTSGAGTGRSRSPSSIRDWRSRWAARSGSRCSRSS